MRKFKLKSVAVIILVLTMCLSFNISVLAASRTNEDGRTKGTDSFSKQGTADLIQQVKNKFQAEMKKQKKNTQEKQTMKPMSPAPHLTDAYIYAMVSEMSLSDHPDVNGWEYFNYGTQGKSTKFHHGGEAIIATVEIGYPNTSIAKYNNENATLIESDPLTSKYSKEAYGNMLFWDIPNVNGGQFTYDVTADEYPYTSYNDWLYIN